MIGVLIRRGKLGRGDTDTEERQPWDDRGRDWSHTVTNQAKPRLLATPRSRKRQGSILQKFWGEHGLPTSWFQMSSLQNYKLIHFCCFNPSSLQHLVIEALWGLNVLQHTGQPTVRMNCTFQLLVVSRLRKSAKELRSITLIEHFIT